MAIGPCSFPFYYHASLLLFFISISVTVSNSTYPFKVQTGLQTPSSESAAHAHSISQPTQGHVSYVIPMSQ